MHYWSPGSRVSRVSGAAVSGGLRGNLQAPVPGHPPALSRRASVATAPVHGLPLISRPCLEAGGRAGGQVPWLPGAHHGGTLYYD